MSIATPAKPTIDLTVLEDMEFDAELPCEFPQSHARGIWGHGGPGELYIKVVTRCGCYEGYRRLICRGVYDYAFRAGVHCNKCQAVYARDEAWRVVGSVK